MTNELKKQMYKDYNKPISIVKLAYKYSITIQKVVKIIADMKGIK